MNILNDILQNIPRDAAVEEVRLGLHWTAVVSRFCGLASTIGHESCHEHNESDIEATGSLTDMTGLALARHCFSEDISKASLGLAAINSLIEVNTEKCADIDGLKLVYQFAKDKNISVIGHFPFLEELAKASKNLWIIEKRPLSDDYPEEKSSEFIPQSDIVVISGTTLINHTLSGILDLCPKQSVKMLIGPTTPMTTALYDHGIDILSGSTVLDTRTILKYISEGANFVRLKKTGAVRFVTMIRDQKEITRKLEAEK